MTAATDAQTLTVSAEDNYGRSAVMFAHVSFEGPTCFTVPNCPQPGYRFWIPGDALPGFPVGTVYADGFQTNGQRMPVHYSVFGPDHGLFGIDSATYVQLNSKNSLVHPDKRSLLQRHHPVTP